MEYSLDKLKMFARYRNKKQKELERLLSLEHRIKLALGR